jgi:hypothetical protein
VNQLSPLQSVATVFNPAETQELARVRCEQPPRSCDVTINHDDDWKTYDSLFLIGGKQVRFFGDVERGDAWKGELREELSRVFPAIQR